MSASSSRLLKELLQCKKMVRGADNIETLQPIDEDELYHWTGTIMGPTHTPYRGRELNLDIKIPPEYPLKPPTVRFTTPVFHPNVRFETGEICLDILQQQWSPAWTLRTVLVAILALLESPEPDSPLNVDAARLIRIGDSLGYESMAEYYLKKN